MNYNTIDDDKKNVDKEHDDLNDTTIEDLRKMQDEAWRNDSDLRDLVKKIGDPKLSDLDKKKKKHKGKKKGSSGSRRVVKDGFGARIPFSKTKIVFNFSFILGFIVIIGLISNMLNIELPFMEFFEFITVIGFTIIIIMIILGKG